MPSRGSKGTPASRRAFLLKTGGMAAIVAGASSGLSSSNAFDLVEGARSSPVDVATEGDGIVGIVRQDTVKKNSRDPMVEFINNGTEDVDIQVSLNNCGDGTLYNNNGTSGCSVVLTLPVGQSEYADIDADVSGTIPYDVSISEVGGTDFELLTSGTVESQSGNNKAAAIRIKAPVNDNKFTANTSSNDWDVDAVDIQDDDGDDDLTEVKFEVSVSGTGVVGSKTVNLDPATEGAEYKLSGNELPLKITPNNGHTVQSGTQYTLTTRAEDADGNFATSTVDDTPGGTATPTATATPSPTTTGTPSNQAPAVDSTTITTTGSKSRKFQIDATVSDPENNLDRVDITVVRTQNNQTGYSNTLSVSGGSDSISDTTGQLKNNEQYRIDVTVYDGNGKSATKSVTKSTG